MRTRVRHQWLLPIAHALIDCILLVSWTRDAPAPGPTVQPALLQDDESIAWDPVYDAPPGPVLALYSGNLPAALLADLLRPGALGRINTRHADPIWLVLNEVFALAFWTWTGRRADGGGVWLRRVMLPYVGARLAFTLTGLYEVGSRVQVLFWLGFALWAAGVSLARLARLGLRRGR